MVILFEGFDNTGKTEISVELAKRLDYSRYKDIREHECFNGKNEYLQELSLVYETYKTIAYLDQGIIQNLILDRDYVSEYVYGRIFRPELYNKYECDKYVWKYDELFRLQDMHIIVCYKDKYKTFSDPVVNIDDKKKVVNGYLDFLSKTVNKTLLINTESENLDEQISEILKWLQKSKAIESYNEKIYMEKSKDSNRIFFPGKFNGDKILFVGQNPGQPLPGDDFSKHLHTIKYDNFKQFMVDHNKSYNDSKYYKFLLKLTKELGLFPSDFSFTNIVKYSTANNRSLMTQEITDGLEILKEQIEIFQPKVIISFGVSAHKALTELDIKHSPYYHPARYYYKTTHKIKEG